MSDIRGNLGVPVFLALTFVFASMSGIDSADAESRNSKHSVSVSVDKVEHLDDGGTTVVTLTDEDAKNHVFYFDGSLISKTPSRIYYGSIKDDGKNAQFVLVPEGDPLEKKLLDLIFRWLDQQYTLREQEYLLTRPTLDGLSEKDFCALRLLRAIQYQHNVAASYRWLNNNYTLGELHNFLTRPSDDDLGKKDSMAWHEVQSLHGYPSREPAASGNGETAVPEP
jgi:hypothetical protein